MPTNREAFSNVIWRLLERFGAQTVTFFVSLVLARLLDAEIYGTVALVMVFITILQVFVDSGLGNALIQKKNADDLDFSTVFIFNIAVCSGLYCLLFLFSPIIARFYKNPDLTSVIRVLGLILIISGVKNVQQAYVSRNMLFKKFFFSTLGGTLGAAVFGVFLAYKGYGIWALVGQYLFNNTVDMLILWITVGWRPHLNFSFIRLKGLFSYGWKLLVSTLLNVGINDLNSLVIGKVYAPSSLGFYENGKKIPAWTMSNIASAIDSVLFPSMSAEQDNKERLKVMTSRSIKTTTYALMPMLMGLAVCSEPLIRILLTEKWIQSVFYLRVYQSKVDEVVDIVKNYSSSHFNPAYIKLFADGVVEAGTGWILREYNVAEEGKKHGNIIWTQDELNAITQYANSKGIIIHTHAYGDGAVRSALDAYIASNKANRKMYRNCLAHVRNIRPEDILRAAEYKIPIAENLIWHTDFDDSNPEQIVLKQAIFSYLPQEIYYSGYPMKSLLEKGVIMGSSTDAPAAETVEGSIMNVLQVAVTGIQPNDTAQPFAEEELLTIEEGLKALTINGAWQLGLEKERGSIKTGKYADFVILDKNILEYGKDKYDKIGETKILSTYFEGENVYSAQDTLSMGEFGKAVKVADMLYEVNFDE